jgi:leader peptidase (prepilin peptidase) / N-methyltransferase
MVIGQDEAYPDDLADDLRPNWTLVGVGTLALAAVSVGALPLPLAVVSIALGALMIAGADVDARTCILPDTITFSAFACGVLAAVVPEPLSPWSAMVGALARAAATAGALAAVRFGYARLTGKEGIGFGDVKLAGAVGAWLPFDHVALCFAIASATALLYALFAHWRGNAMHRTSRIAFGAFLCPALWFVFFAGLVAA